MYLVTFCVGAFQRKAIVIIITRVLRGEACALYVWHWLGGWIYNLVLGRYARVCGGGGRKEYGNMGMGREGGREGCRGGMSG